ncbi:MAG: prolyl oligopeptidase family serine peptidase [Sulfurifustis sp.]
MPTPVSAPYGSWTSPITADLIAADTVALSGIRLDGEALYWSELRGAEGGRSVIVRRTGRGIDEILPREYSARSRVNEYGGGAYTVADGVVYFVNDADQRIYRLAPPAAPVAITPADARRYADLAFDHKRRRVLAVCEDHRSTGEPPQSIVAVDADGNEPLVTLASGRDFYAAPRISPNGRFAAFLAWDHPNMPWDTTDLALAELTDAGLLERAHRIAGGADESIVQPSFGPDGALYFVSDRTGWWNLYRHRAGQTEALAAKEAEFAGPPWVFGLSTYAFVSGDRIVCAYNERGAWRLGVLHLANGAWRTLDTPYNDLGYVCAQGERAVFLAAGPAAPSAVIELDLRTNHAAVVRSAARFDLDRGCLSTPHAIEYETGGGMRAHAFFYPPRNDGRDAPARERPPLIVMSHGGPTSATSSALNLKIQYWTSRGFAVLDVNYRGSTGYGRGYRRALDGLWGLADVEDCVEGARYLVARGEVDGERLAIRGSSAGGYTTLCALTFHRVFRAGASLYGISDLELLAADTHKFESRYTERLVGPYPQERSRYRQRSPIHHADQLSCPMIFFQGSEDRVVPPAQTERMVEALRRRGIPVAYLLFPGERHGFRRAENVRQTLETELRFYGRVFNFATDVDDRVRDPLS